MGTTRTLKKLLPDDRLLSRFVSGDEDAFTILFDRYAPRIQAYVRKMIGDDPRAEELVQETFLRVFRAADRYEDRGRFGAWIFTIATRLCYNEHRFRRSVPCQESLVESLTVSPGAEDPEARMFASIDGRRFAGRVERLLEELTDNHRTVFVLKHFHQMTYVEIAEVLGISEGTAKSRLHFAVRRLRALLEREANRASSGPLRLRAREGST